MFGRGLAAEGGDGRQRPGAEAPSASEAEQRLFAAVNRRGRAEQQLAELGALRASGNVEAVIAAFASALAAVATARPRSVAGQFSVRAVAAGAKEHAVPLPGLRLLLDGKEAVHAVTDATGCARFAVSGAQECALAALRPDGSSVALGRAVSAAPGGAMVVEVRRDEAFEESFARGERWREAARKAVGEVEELRKAFGERIERRERRLRGEMRGLDQHIGSLRAQASGKGGLPARGGERKKIR
ncbi:hypothetical protein SCE1572_47630 [Sorangium cellulosum So0157-2]|uniref:Uncharacterized protein n=2 Tax=Sorangium cellulosum TaxID=56 RepID=S4Y9D1_SORCE|nr:hypothetical protein SCE1572_47630 [Sorangium cellulosum So0157-2]